MIVFLIFWQWITQGSKKLLFLFSSPEQIWHKALAEYQSSTIWNDIWVTSLETILGLSIGTLLGLIVGLLMWGNGQFEKIAKNRLIGSYLKEYGLLGVYNIKIVRNNGVNFTDLDIYGKIVFIHYPQ